MAGVSGQKTKRIFYIDNLRLFLITLVVLHHVAVAYGGSGSWPLKENPTDSISPIIFLIFNAINQSFFLSLFYMLSGYFVPRSYDKKGPGRFLVDRLIRLGIPLLVFTTILSTLVVFLVVNFARGETVSILKIVTHRIQHPYWDVGPLWFVEALLIFSVIYVLFRIVFRFSYKPFQDTFPTNAAITLSIVAIAACTFIVRIWYPVGKQFHVFQLGHFVHYIFCFWIGILAYRGKWFDNLSQSQARLWKIVALITIFALPIMMGAMMAAGEFDIEVALGGFSWQSLLVSVWESIACISIIISLLSIFQKRFSNQGNLLRWMSPNFYAVYILHQLVIVAVMIPLLNTAILTPVKFLIVAIISVLLCFVLGDLIRKIPYTKRVLG
jgi:fucose 4-O-acetylase-like acetyltransferase